MGITTKDRFIHTVQKLLLNVAFVTGKIYPNHFPNDDVWVVGTVEVAGLTKMLADAVPDSYSVLLETHRYYDYKYDFQGSVLNNHLLSRLLHYFTGPILLGYLASRVRGFIFIGRPGFLISQVDYRDYEFSFLKRRGKKLICYLTGADIRSPLKMRLAFEKSGEENYGNYVPFLNPAFTSDAYELEVKEIARVIDKYTDAFFNAEYDQASHLTRKALALMYFYPMQDVEFNSDKYVRMTRDGIRILHAPSSPIPKGTQVVRTVIRMLQNEGYEFEYTELSNSPNSQVLEQLHDTHIVINELYAFMPGVFAIEAMALSCVVLTRADFQYETQLPASSSEAWIVTPAYSLYTNMKKLLENPMGLEIQARKGFEWVRANASLEASGPRLNSILKSL